MSELKTTTIKNLAGTKSIPCETVIAGSAKAWVNFKGTGVIAINDDFNIETITDNGTGDYTIAFTTAMTDANYVISFSLDYNATSAANIGVGIDPYSRSTSQAIVLTGNYTDTLYDFNTVMLTFNGN